MDLKLQLVILSLLLITVSRGQESRYASEYENLYLGPYKHIYPPVDITQDPGDCTPNGTARCPLFLAYMTGFAGGGFDASGSIPGVQIALDQINDDPTMLPGYTLHYLLKDSQVN